MPDLGLYVSMDLVSPLIEKKAQEYFRWEDVQLGTPVGLVRNLVGLGKVVAEQAPV